MLNNIKQRITKEAIATAKEEITNQVTVQCEKIEKYIPLLMSLATVASLTISMRTQNSAQRGVGRWVNVENYGEVVIRLGDVAKEAGK